MNVITERPAEPDVVITVSRKEACLFEHFQCGQSCFDYKQASDLLKAINCAIRMALA